MKRTLLALALLASAACASSQQQTFFKRKISVDCLVSQEQGRIEELVCDHNGDGRDDYWYEASYAGKVHPWKKKEKPDYLRYDESVDLRENLHLPPLLSYTEIP